MNKFTNIRSLQDKTKKINSLKLNISLLDKWLLQAPCDTDYLDTKSRLETDLELLNQTTI